MPLMRSEPRCGAWPSRCWAWPKATGAPGPWRGWRSPACCWAAACPPCCPGTRARPCCGPWAGWRSCWRGSCWCWAPGGCVSPAISWSSARPGPGPKSELRSWLFDGRAPGSIDGQGVTLAAGVRLIQQEVEAQHGVIVEAVTVGDCELDDDLSALLAVAREATVNAVKWSGASVVSIFAEVEPAEVSL